MVSMASRLMDSPWAYVAGDKGQSRVEDTRITLYTQRKKIASGCRIAVSLELATVIAVSCIDFRC